MYGYEATVTRWIDGDTVDLIIAAFPPLKLTVEARIRLLGVDTPERGSAGYYEARNYSVNLAPPGSRVFLDVANKTDAFGRVLGVVYRGDIDVNNALLESGHAVEYVR